MGSDFLSTVFNIRNYISIHTPLAGSDAALRKCWRSLIFQSTLPLRGATRPDNWTIWPTGYFNPHSPCGERRGHARHQRHPRHFNPHSPCGERQEDLENFRQLLEFQSTLPLRGATGHCHTLLSGHAISIHTPLAGSDACLSHTLPASANFNPHSPCGERPSPSRPKSRGNNFNPHSPCGERHVDAMPHSWVDIFQSTLPLRGATRVRGDGTTMLVISIHTPLAGSDTEPPARRLRARDFNPHSPCGERQVDLDRQGKALVFQSTLPLRGATGGSTF